MLQKSQDFFPICSKYLIAVSLRLMPVFVEADLHVTELQIRGSTEDNSKIIFLISQRHICCDLSLEPSQRDGSNDGSQNMF